MQSLQEVRVHVTQFRNAVISKGVNYANDSRPLRWYVRWHLERRHAGGSLTLIS